MLDFKTASPPKNGVVKDATLFQRVHQALAQVDALQLSGLPILVQVDNGTVTLQGAVGSLTTKAKTLHAVHSVAGVERVRDKLLTDVDLQTRISDAMAASPDTGRALQAVQVRVHNGTVLLVGQVLDDKVRNAAGNIALRTPGVRAVSNRLRVKLNTRGLDDD
jgi:osmotically-inducible protein OsmY